MLKADLSPAGPGNQSGARRGHTRVRKWLLRTAIAAVAMIVAAAGAGKFYLTRVESRALRLAQTGTSLNSFLKAYVDAFKHHDAAELLELYVTDYAGDREGLWVENLLSDRDGVQVYVWSTENPRRFSRADLGKQAEQFWQRIGQIESGKFKISSIDLHDIGGGASITAVFSVRGRSVEGQTLESRATFRLKVQPQGQSWKIAAKELLKGQTVIGQGRGFTDITRTAGVHFEARHNPMLSEPEWFPKKFGIMKYATAGVAVADYDGDGWCDVYFCDGANARLYRNCCDGSFEDSTIQAGIPEHLAGVHVALFVDLDNDGDKDLFLGRGTGQNLLFRNDGAGAFTDVTALANIGGVWVATAAAADYDNDGLVDLYLGRYLDPRKNLPTTNFYTRNGEGNSLLHNEGGLRFRDVTDVAGVREGGLSLGLCWGDYDSDGYQDVYVANDFGRNVLYRNNGNGTFTDASSTSGALNFGYGMSSSFADIDNDGDLDIYVAGVHSGQRWFGNAATLERYLLTSIQEGTIIEDFPLYRELFSLIGGNWKTFGERVIRGNALFLNNGNGTFTDVTESADANPHGWYWSSQIADFDNDGLQDIYAVNGWITGRSDEDL